MWVIANDASRADLRPVTNTLVENDIYTIGLQSGERELILERTFAQIEGIYAQIYDEKISRQQELTVEEKANLTFFVAAMLTRPSARGRHLRDQLAEVAGRIHAMEEEHGMPVGRSAAAHEIEN